MVRIPYAERYISFVKVLSLVTFSLLILSCGRDTKFIYHQVDPPPAIFSTMHKLKEMTGENRVDILFVIDNSGSMGSHQTALIKNAEKFIDTFAVVGGLDWKMGVVSTSVMEKPYIGFEKTDELTYKTPDNIKLFKKAVGRLGTSGDSMQEREFEPVMKWLKDYPDFVRPRAILALILITDEEEQSRIPAKDFLDFLEKTKGSLNRVITYGVFGASDLSCSFGFVYGKSPLEEAIKTTNGKAYSLCLDFGVNLADMGKDLVSRVQRPMLKLRSRPSLQTLSVKYQGKPLKGGLESDGGIWIYDFDANSIVFHNVDFAPGENEEVEVEYEVAKTSFEYSR